MVAGRRAAVEVGCEEVEEERARVGGDAVVLCLWLNVEPVRLRGVQSMRCAASPRTLNCLDLSASFLYVP